ncbi:MAG: hypothetical protein ACR2QF_16945, partial [Geminicoccaceae bacterium]
MGKSLPLTTFFVLAVFAATGGIIWLAYSDTGKVVGEPPLVRASATPLKQVPDDPGGRTVADLGGVGELLADQPAGVTEEKLMPTPEQPLSPAEAAVASLEKVGGIDRTNANPEERKKAKAALEALISELRLEENAPSGVGGPVSARLASPARPSKVRARAEEQPSNSDITLQPNEPEPRRNPDISSNVQLAVVSEDERSEGVGRFQEAPGGRFLIQLAAVREEEDAKRAWEFFQEQHGAQIGDFEPFFEMA